jgi:hypothetical protein
MPSTDRKLEVKARISMAQTDSQAAVYAKGLIQGAKYPVARSPLAIKYFSLAIGIWPFFF